MGTQTTENKVAQASALIKAIKYDKRNSYDGYDYASADSIFQAVREAIAEAGLTLWIHEERFELTPADNLRTGTSYSHVMIGTFRVGFTDSHEPPPDWNRFERMSFPLPWLNVQSRGALTTYVEKMYLRAKFQLPTGDLAEEIDHGHLDPGDKPPPANNGRGGGGGGGGGRGGGQRQAQAAAPPENRANAQAAEGAWGFNSKGVLEESGTFADQVTAQRALWRFIKAEFGPQERTASKKKTDQTRITKCWPFVRHYLAGEAQSGREYLETMLTNQGFTLPEETAEAEAAKE